MRTSRLPTLGTGTLLITGSTLIRRTNFPCQQKRPQSDSDKYGMRSLNEGEDDEPITMRRGCRCFAFQGQTRIAIEPTDELSSHILVF